MKRTVLVLMCVVSVSGVAWGEEVDILTKIHTVFQGNHTKEDIKNTLDVCLMLYGVEVNDTTYEQTASMALELRKKGGGTEMEILACTAELLYGEYPVRLKFTDAAALCATALALDPPKTSLFIQLNAHIAQLNKKIEELEALQTASPSKPKPKAPSGVLQEIDDKIRARAAERYPDNFSTQGTYIEMERESYQWIQAQTAPDGVPEDVYQKIVDRAAERYADSYSTQETYIKMETESYLELQ